MADRRTSRVYTARGAAEGEDWPAVAAALNERMAERRIGQQALANASGVSVSTVRLVQHGADRRVQNKTLAALARALDWPDDHLVRVLLGAHADDPAADDGQPRAVGVEILDGVREIRDELRRIARRLDDMDCARRPTPR
jgi:DNA-binding Xre family transcriptional regulator